MASGTLEQLLQESEDLAYADRSGLALERTLPQIAKESYDLASRAGAVVPFGSTDRILAERNADSAGLNDRVEALETRLAWVQQEDVFAATTVDDYTQHVQETIILTAIHQSISDAQSSFEAFMTEKLEAEWAAEKRQLFDYSTPHMITAATSSIAAQPSLSSPYTPSTTRARSPGFSTPGTSLVGTRSAAQASPGDMGALRTLPRGAAPYSSEIAALVDARVNGEQYNAIAQFAAVTPPASGVDAASRQQMWQLAAAVVGNSGGSAQTLIRNGRKFLESQYAGFMSDQVRRNRVSAARGGDPSDLDVVKAFLRVQQRGGEFDDGVQLWYWQQIFFSMRAGYPDAAIKAARSSVVSMSMGLPHGQLERLLESWKRGDVPQEEADIARTVAHSALSELARSQYDASKLLEVRAALLVLTVLSGDGGVAEKLVRDPTLQSLPLFTTIEDYLWFKLAIVRCNDASHNDPGVVKFTLMDLQRELQQQTAEHYSRNRTVPLRYVFILLLSLQFKAALSFLAADASTAPYRVDAVHLAIALFHHGVLNAGGDGDSSAVDIGGMIHDYAQQFVTENVTLAALYCLLAAQIAAGNDAHRLLSLKARLLQELLVRSKAYGMFFGGGASVGEGSVLAKYEPDGRKRSELLQRVAEECVGAAQFDEAVELYEAAGAYEAALSTINDVLSDAIQRLADTNYAGNIEAYIQKGKHVKERPAMVGAAAPLLSDAHMQANAFDILVQLCDLVRAVQQRRFADGMQMVRTSVLSSVLPQQRHSIDSCIMNIRQLPESVKGRLPLLLQAAVQCCSACRTDAAVQEWRPVLQQFAQQSDLQLSAQTYRLISQLLQF